MAGNGKAGAKRSLRSRIDLKAALLISVLAFCIPLVSTLSLHTYLKQQDSMAHRPFAGHTGYTAPSALRQSLAVRDTLFTVSQEAKLARRASKKAAKSGVVTKTGCTWNTNIEGTYTRPLWIVLGMSLGSIFGMIILGWAYYAKGASPPSGGGGGGMGMGMGPPPY